VLINRHFSPETQTWNYTSLPTVGGRNSAIAWCIRADGGGFVKSPCAAHPSRRPPLNRGTGGKDNLGE
jgi:hypothetical protein